MDLIEGTKSEKGKWYIFMAIDHYSKWIEPRTLKFKMTIDIKRAIISQIIEKLGIPETIQPTMGPDSLMMKCTGL